MRLCSSGLSRPLTAYAAILLLSIQAVVSERVAEKLAKKMCKIGDDCSSCDIEHEVGDRCRKEDATHLVLFCNNRTGLIYPEEDAYLSCVSPRMKLRKRHCPMGSYYSENHKECLDITIRKYRQAYTTGSSRLGDTCVQNTDCIDYLMYCSSGICACTSSAVQINDVCYKKVEPSGTGCSYNEQCSSYWPDTVCTSGTCTCPTNFHTSNTRDGNVCVRDSDTTNGFFFCPLPELAQTAQTSFSPTQTYIASVMPLYVTAGSTTPTSCNLNQGCTNTVASVTTTTVPNPVSLTDLYDCIQTTGATVTTGICCPSRSFTCAQPVLNGGATSGTPTQRYYYDSVAGVCDQFTYYRNGADETNTNGNNFATRDHCVTYCQDTCERGAPQYSTGSTDPRQLNPLGCTATSDTCDSDHTCDRIGSNYLCCPEPEYVCGLYGARGSSGSTIYNTVPTGADSGFSPRLRTNPPSATRYFFNPNLGSCQTFQYYYGGGNYNNYASENDCTNYCYQELCTNGNPLKTTTGENQRCSSDSDCPTSYQCTSGTGATSIQICCPRSQTICEQDKVIGTCTNWVRRYWHNAATGECEQFQYSGCGGNDNNFKLQITCQTACRDTTRQPQCVQGLAYKDSYGKYYKCTSSGTGTTQCPANYRCEFDGFMWGCCPQQNYACSLTADSGRTCGAAVSRWYYDTSNQRCISFTYYGCDGNPNNFPSKSLCETYCGVGGCPNGGQAYRESNTGYITVCSGAVACPSGYECDTVNEGGSTVSRCCPTKATICSTPPSQGQSCGSISTERYYFNRVTRACTTFTYQGCQNAGNNFGTLAQCNNFCSSAACGAGEVVYLDPNTQQPRTCNQQLTNACPTGFTCRYDSLAQRYVCCGATNEGVCTATEKAYIEALTMAPRKCMPNIASTCPNQYQCRYNNRRGQYFCCAPMDGSVCPTGRAPFYDTATRSPVSCTISSVVNSCSTGYTCQTVVPQSFSGYCCTAGSVCPNGVNYDKNSFNNPVQCNIGGIAVCRSGYSCQTTLSGTTSGYCCEGTGSAENAGCPPNQYVQKDQAGNIPTCNPFGAVTGCTVGNTCQWSNQRNSYQCCGSNPQSIISTGSFGCPSSQVAFLDPANNNQPRICPSVVSSVCPTGYFCQYSTERSVIQCCGVQEGCPTGSVAYIGSTGSAQQCSQNFGGCPSGFQCVSGSLGHSICCTIRSGQTPSQPQPQPFQPFQPFQPISKQREPNACPSHQVPFNNQCLDRVTFGKRCTIDEQCLSDASCIDFRCKCPKGSVLDNGHCKRQSAPNTNQNQNAACAPGQISWQGRCLNPAGPDEVCQIPEQCVGGAQCQGSFCRCQPGFTAVNGVCIQARDETPPTTFAPPTTQAINLEDYCPAAFAVYTDAGVPRSCTGNSYACPSDHRCMYASKQRQYYCCRRASQTPAPGIQGCPRGQPLIYEPTNTPLVCSPGAQSCPPGYECLQSSIPVNGQTVHQCCGSGTIRSASSTRKVNEQEKQNNTQSELPAIARCAAHEVLVIRHFNGQTIVRCQNSCPPNQVPVKGVCRELTRLNDDVMDIEEGSIFFIES